MRRIGTLAAACALATGMLATTLTPAQAAPAPSNAAAVAELIKVANGNVANANCNVLGIALRGAGMVGADTTRSQLVSKVHATIGDQAAIRLVAAPTVNALGDRALACNIVKADPVTPLDQAVAFSSQLSSRAGLPEARDLLAAVGR